MRDRNGRHEAPPGSPLLVGVFPGQHPEVLEKALNLANGLDRRLVFAFVVEGTDRSEWSAGGPMDFHALSSDERSEIDGTGIEAVNRMLEAALAKERADCRLHVLLGNPAKALARAAHDLDAAMIIIGSHRRMSLSPRARFLHASTASRLLSRQDRPVLIVPPSAERQDPRLALDP